MTLQALTTGETALAMSRKSVDKEYVKTRPGVYFFAYSVPQVIAVHMQVSPDLGPGAKIYHCSVVCSDGNGKVETITAGPAETSAWFKQFGFTPVTAQISFLSHPDESLIKKNFDSIAWTHPELQRIFMETNWTEEDFIVAKQFASSSFEEISSIGYNLGGHNSNSLLTLVWKIVSQNAAKTSEIYPDSPNSLLSTYFRPGSNYGLFEKPKSYYTNLAFNWFSIVKIAMLCISNLSAYEMRQLLMPERSPSLVKGNKWGRKRREGD